MTTLHDAATEAGLVDDELLKLAKPGLSPTEAMQELKGRYPGAFREMFDARTATKEERAAWMARYRGEQITRRYQQIDNASLERAQEKYGVDGDKR